MKPIRTPRTNYVFKMPGDATTDGDLPCQLERDVTDPRGGYLWVKSSWDLTPAERIAIAEGATVELLVWQVPPPPVSLAISTDPRELLPQDFPPETEAAPDV